jgi:hypothetical protein
MKKLIEGVRSAWDESNLCGLGTDSARIGNNDFTPDLESQNIPFVLIRGSSRLSLVRGDPLPVLDSMRFPRFAN